MIFCDEGGTGTEIEYAKPADNRSILSSQSIAEWNKGFNSDKIKRTGIVRELDELGRVKIRYELCKAFGIEDNTTHLELLVIGGFVQVQEKLNDQTFLFSKKN
ncbi:hypothetical protein ABFY59_29175 [Priestia aryabhattai]|uniref:hypothetical protein n=1 Tax=Priestia aryabhattai TaxID=412384 RepID=UPI003D290AEF